MKPKIQDVAAAAGVSKATVSMVLTGNGKISEDVSKNVLSAAEKIGYKRNQPKGSSTQYIAVLAHCCFPYQWNFIQPFIDGIQNYLVRRSYFPLVINSSPESDPVELFQWIRASGASAMIAIHHNDKAMFQRTQIAGIPVIILNNNNHQRDFHTVSVDDFQGAYEGTHYLLELGHKRILFFEYNRPDQPSVVADRFIGFKKALDEEGIEFPAADRIVLDIGSFEKLAAQVKESLYRRHETTAIFIHDDYLAGYVHKALEGIGIDTPRNMSIIAPGDVLSYDEPFVPRITTMKINTSIMGELAARTAVSVLENKLEGLQVLKVKEQLVDRGSCRAVR